MTRERFIVGLNTLGFNGPNTAESGRWVSAGPPYAASPVGTAPSPTDPLKPLDVRPRRRAGGTHPVTIIITSSFLWGIRILPRLGRCNLHRDNDVDLGNTPLRQATGGTGAGQALAGVGNLRPLHQPDLPVRPLQPVTCPLVPSGISSGEARNDKPAGTELSANWQLVTMPGAHNSEYFTGLYQTRQSRNYALRY